jgi:hypothetical protein
VSTMATNQVIQQIEEVFTLFRSAHDLAASLDTTEGLLQHLDSAKGPFISVVYEGAAAGMAYRQIQAGASKLTVPDWPAHGAQVHIGIGWGIAEAGARPDAYVHQFSGIMQGRVLDGYGYYSGLFRRRRSIQAMEIPEGIPTELLTAFDQGLGRAMWYISKGETGPLMTMIEAFPEERKTGLWRGIGVASSYVGGITPNEHKSLIDHAGSMGTELAVGLLLCASGRVTAGTGSAETESFLHLHGLTVDDVMATADILLQSPDYNAALAGIHNLASGHRT